MSGKTYSKRTSPSRGSSIFVGVDIGGTFTDLVFFDESNPTDVQVVKVSTNTKKPEKGVVDAFSKYRAVADRILLFAHATTVATNALLTHRGLAKCALITNQGFRDVLEIGRQRRPEIYDLNTRRPPPLVPRKDRFVVRGRIAADGSEVTPLNIADVRDASRKIRRGKFDSVAIVYLHSYLNPKHEKRTKEILKRTGFKGHIDISSDIDPQYREYERTSTTVVNSTLAPVVADYLARFQKELSSVGLDCPIYVMNSDGTSSSISHAVQEPISIIESGPAAGVLSSKSLADARGLDRVITFDMGGTTAKAGIIINGQPDLSYEFEAAGKTHSGRSIKGSGYPVRYPFIDLAEVSSGGGTIAWVDEAGALHAGPQSAGAEPGPAAYGNGGTEATVTDANIVLGRLNPKHLLGGALRLHYDLAERAVERKVASKLGLGLTDAAVGIIKIVHHNMARAISLVSVERGRDPRDFAMISFGGAGPMHSCELAEELGVKRVIVPKHPGLFSARGLLVADLSRTLAVPVMKLATDNLEPFFRELRIRAKEAVQRDGFAEYSLNELIDLRYKGQSYEITLPYRKGTDLNGIFGEQHRRLYGYSSDDPVEVVNARATVIVPTPKARFSKQETQNTGAAIASQSTRNAWISNSTTETPVYTRESLMQGAAGAKGPCIIEEYDSTTIVPDKWSWRIDEYANIELTDGT